MERIRLFLLIASSSAGGAEEVFASLLRRLNRDRFEVFVACHGQDLLYDEYRQHADRIWSLDLPRMTRPHTVVRLARLMRETKCDIVHTHLWSADLVGGLAARFAGVRRTVSTVQGAYFLGIGAHGLARVRRRALSQVFRATYGLFDRVIAVSRHVASDLAERPGLKVPSRRIEVIHNGLDLARLEAAVGASAASPRPWASAGPIVTTVANFHPYKGHEWLIRSMPRVVERFPNVRFVLVGDGDTRAQMEALVDSLGVRAHVVFTGRIPNGAHVMLQSDLVVMPSIAAEGLPIALLEALALGKPVVATPAGGVPEVIGDDEAGVLVPVRDPQALARGIVRVLSEPDETRRRVERGRQIVRERFSAEAMVHRTEELYLALAAGRPGQAR